VTSGAAAGRAGRPEALHQPAEAERSGPARLLQDWLHNVYIAEDAAEAFMAARHAAAGGCFVTPQGHVIHAVQRALLRRRCGAGRHAGRQQEIDNITKQLRAQQMLAEEARARSVRADAAAVEPRAA
jgi:chromosome segregation protein